MEGKPAPPLTQFPLRLPTEPEGRWLKQQTLEELRRDRTSRVSGTTGAYSSIEIVPDDYLADARQAFHFEEQRDLNKIGKPADRTEWFMSPPTVNAYGGCRCGLPVPCYGAQR